MTNHRFTYRFLIGFMLWFVSSIVVAQQTEQQKLEVQRKVLQEEIAKIKNYLEKTKKKENTVSVQVQDLFQKIKTREKLIATIDKELDLLSTDITKNASQIQKMQQQLDALKKEYADMIYKSYKNKNNQSNMLFLLSAHDFQQSYLRYQYVKQYNQYRKKQGELIQQRAEQLQTLNDSLQRKKANKVNLMTHKKVEQSQLEKEKTKQEELAKTYQKQKKEYQAQIKKKQEEERKLSAQIEEAIRAAITQSNLAKNKGNTKATKAISTTEKAEFILAPEDKVLAGEFTANKGKLPWPVEKGIVTVRFGKQPDPMDSKLIIESSGVRIATAENQKARVIFNGVVLAVQKNPQTGLLSVLVQHGNYISVYANLTNVSVKKGQKVTTKQNIGTIHTDSVTGKTILKFQIWENTNKLNPASWIDKM